VKSRGSQCNETLLVRAAVLLGKKLGLQSAAKNLQWRRCAYWLRQTVPNMRSCGKLWMVEGLRRSTYNSWN